MDMQDKEFDGLFRSALGDMEVQPASKIWINLDNELKASNRSRKWVPYLSIAASVIGLIVISVLFIPAKIKIINNNYAGKKAIKTIAAKELPGVIATVHQKNHQLISNKLTPVKKTINNNFFAAGHRSMINRSRYIMDITDTLPKTTTYQQLITASLPDKTKSQSSPALPDEDTQIIVREPVQENTAFITKPAIASLPPVVNEKHDVVQVKKKNKIRSFGDLMNVMIAKVDKRHDKIIEFTDTDGDESTITGINLGIIKIKKEDK